MLLMTNGILMKIESTAECYTFDLHQAIVGLVNQFLVLQFFCSALCTTSIPTNLMNRMKEKRRFFGRSRAANIVVCHQI